MVKVLLVEDDARISQFVRRGLEGEGYVVDRADNGHRALALADENGYRLIVLDRMLPGLDGVEVCTMLRQRRSKSLILMLTAKDSLQDKVDGLKSGADDYLTKPFAFDELLARMQALLRRGPYEDVPQTLKVADLVLTPATRNLKRGEREIVLTTKEYALLSYLMENAGKVLSRSRLLNHVWGYSFEPGTKILEVYIRYLRKKIDEGEERALIQTVRGIGYMITDGTQRGPSGAS
jgi:DNA-binding response OmpR family regulator